MLNAESRIVKAENQVSSDLGGEAVILSLDDGMYYGLDAVGARVWDLIQQPRKVAEIQQAIVSEYDVDAAQCEADLLALLQDMAGRGLIKVEDDSPA